MRSSTAFDPEVALSHWGYEPSGANGMRAIAALKQYGLLIEERADGEHTLKLSELAIDVLIPEEEGGEEHKNYLRAAAKTPPLFELFWEQYGESGLPSDRNLERFLIKERGFNPSAVPDVIRIFKDTVDFSGLEFGTTIPASKSSDDPGSQQKNMAKPEWADAIGRHLFGPPTARIANKEQNHSTSGMLELPLTLPSLKIAVLRRIPRLK